MDGTKERDMMLPSLNEEFSKNFQSMFYMLNGKPDSKTKVFNKDICVNLDNIDDLNERVLRKIKSHYDPMKSANIININITFEDGRNISFSGWDKYKQTKITNPSAVKNFTIIWDFLLKLPNYQFAQRHKLIVKITDGMKPQELLNLVLTGKIEEVEDISIDSPLVVSVDFIDMQIGDELINIVAEWVKTVETSKDKKKKILNVLSGHKRKISYFLNWLTTIVSVGCVCFVLYKNISLYKNCLLADIPATALTDWLIIIFLGYICCFFVYRISYYISNNIFRILETHGEVHIFNITNGDKNEIENLKKINDSNWKRITCNFLLTLLIDFLCSVLTNYIVELL